MSQFRCLAPILVSLLACQCGNSSAPSGPVITITNFQYSPASLAVKPGTTVTVVNRDADAHSVTSQSSANAFKPGAVAGIQFDTGSFHTTARFSLPTTALPGTVIPYYCTVHGTMTGMGTGQITILPP